MPPPLLLCRRIADTWRAGPHTQDPVESRMAPLIKREMDKLYSPTWHVFIGKDFGANVTHENKSFISFILGPLSFLVFKSG